MNNSLYNKVFLEEQYHSEVVDYYFREWDGYSIKHAHNAVEIMYALKGKCLIEVSGKTIPMKSGDFILLDANVEHRLMVDQGIPCRMLNIEFIFTKMTSFFPSFAEIVKNCSVLREFLSFKKPYVVLKDNDEIYSSLKSLINELGEHREDGIAIVHTLMLQLFLQLSRLTLKAERNMLEASDVYVQKAMQYIQHNYDCDIQIKDIASEISIHPIYLHRIFKRRAGCTLVEYLTQFRMDKAKVLLVNTDIPIIEISNYVGINSRQYFSYLFKKNTGMAPAKYRRQNSEVY